MAGFLPGCALRFVRDDNREGVASSEPPNTALDVPFAPGDLDTMHTATHGAVPVPGLHHDPTPPARVDALPQALEFPASPLCVCRM